MLSRFALGEYHPANETWVTEVATATIDYGPNSNWEYAGFVGAVKGDKDKRFMNIGCVSSPCFLPCRVIAGCAVLRCAVLECVVAIPVLHG